MSMSEFERYMREPEDDLSHLSMHDRAFPEDFSDEDVEFARELDSLFDLDKEEIPPYFVQTLLESDDPRFQTLEEGFEKKTRAHVFRRLDLHRNLFRSSSSRFQRIVRSVPARRSFFALAASAMLIMVCSMLYVAPSFASGLAILLAGPHSGVVQVHSAPKGGIYSPSITQPAASGTPASDSLHTMSLLQAQRLLHFSMYWPQSDALPNNYTPGNIYIYDNAGQSWADGPIMRLDYDYSHPGSGGTSRADGHLAIYEFKPLGKVLQVVQLGAASQLKIDSQGNASAIYVDGEWTTIDQSSHTWIYNDRSELIYERDGVIFWIVGHQHDGINKDILSNIASSLQVFNVNYYAHMGRIYDVMQNSGSVPDLIAGDIIYMDNPNNPNGPMLQVVGADPSPSPDQSSHLPRSSILDN